MKENSKEYSDTLEHARNVLDKHKLQYEFKNHALYIQHPTKDWKAYDYRFTTNRWGTLINRRNKYRKHYSCKNVEELVDKYILSED